MSGAEIVFLSGIGAACLVVLLAAILDRFWVLGVALIIYVATDVAAALIA